MDTLSFLEQGQNSKKRIKNNASLHRMQGKKILIGVSGSIAAYKIPHLVRLLTKAGATVKVMMTPAAAEFVSPLVLSTLSGNPVLYKLAEEDQWADHVHLGRWADAMILAPVSANTLSKMAHGQCDNLLLAVYMSGTCPVWVAPAMDEDMWHHGATQQNIITLRGFGHNVIDSEYGSLASGLVGFGRMAEPETIVANLSAYFIAQLPLRGKKAMVTAGPTHEYIDPVRFIGNASSGKMGIALADALADAGCAVDLVLGPSALRPKNAAVTVHSVVSAADMYEACVALWPSMDIAIKSAAVADYTPDTVSTQKIKKADDALSISLRKTKDILKALGQEKKAGQLLIGFALETNDAEAYALKKLSEKNADMIVLNSLQDEGAGFGYDTNRVTLFSRRGERFESALMSKTDIAQWILQKIIAWEKE
jgi:phosphopantothenoylcysteine decarboxylase/phosphopantothenate--cysteine ligase